MDPTSERGLLVTGHLIEEMFNDKISAEYPHHMKTKVTTTLIKKEKSANPQKRKKVTRTSVPKKSRLMSKIPL